MSENLLKVAKGLKLVYWGLMIRVVAIVLGIVGGILAGIGGAVAVQQGGGGGGAAAAMVPLLIVVGLVTVLTLVGNVVGLVGEFFCFAVPPAATGAKSRVVLSFVFGVCSLVSGLVGNADQLTLNFLPPAAKMVNSGFSILTFLASVIFFLLFAKSLAIFIRRKHLGEDAMSVLYYAAATLILYLVGLGIILGGAILAGGPGGGGPGGGGAGAAAAGGCVGGIVAIASLVVGIIGVVKYAKLLTSLSDATRKFARTVDDNRDDEGEDDYDRDYRPRRDRDDEEDDEPDDDLDDDRGSRRRRD